MARRTLILSTSVALLVTSWAGAGDTPAFPKPTVSSREPQRGCRSTLADFQQPPLRRRILVPGAPGLAASAITSHRIRVTWQVRQLPKACAAAYVMLSVGRYEDWPPMTVYVPTRGKVVGSRIINFPSFGPAPDVALASALTARGARSRTVAVLIRKR